MRTFFLVLMAIFFIGSSSGVLADELTQMAQQELQTLGYDIDNTSGEATTKTIVAISKFQAENSMEVTGEASPQLIGALRAASNPSTRPAAAAQSATAPAVAAAEPQMTLEQRQQACLQEKQAAAQERKKKKRGFGRLLSAVAGTSRHLGGSGVASDISRASHEAYSANATAASLAAAGKDLGLTEDEMEECRNPE